jgi:hypothetical protein
MHGRFQRVDTNESNLECAGRTVRHVIMQTRRHFLARCSVAAAGASIASTAVLVAAPGHRETPLDQISLAQFAAQLNTSFIVRTDSGTARLRLVEVNPLPDSTAGAGDAGNEKFVLVFQGPAASTLGQDTWQFDHRAIGRFSMFIVPVGSLDTTHSYYESTFNRPRNARDYSAQLSRAPKRAR